MHIHNWCSWTSTSLITELETCTFIYKKSRDYTSGATHLRPQVGSLPIRHLRRQNLSDQGLSALTQSKKNSNLLPHTVQQTQLHRFSSLLKSSVLHAHKPNCTQRPLTRNHLGPIRPVPPQNLAFMLTHSTDLWF